MSNNILLATLAAVSFWMAARNTLRLFQRHHYRKQVRARMDEIL